MGRLRMELVSKISYSWAIEPNADRLYHLYRHYLLGCDSSDWPYFLVIESRSILTVLKMSGICKATITSSTQASNTYLKYYKEFRFTHKLEAALMQMLDTGIDR